MSLDTVLMLALVVIVLIYGGPAVVRQAWNAWIAPLLSSLFPPAPPEITSSRPPAPAQIAPSDLQTDQTDDPTCASIAPALKPATLDTCKSLRAHGYSREDARRFLRTVDRTLDNNLWAQAAPPPPPEEDDAILTPIAGRWTKASYYDDPALEYQPPV